MAETFNLDPNQILRVLDNETYAPVLTTGRPDQDSIDTLIVTGNAAATVGATEPGTERTVTLTAGCGASAVIDVSLSLQGKGSGVVLLPIIATASLPAGTAYEGAIAYDATLNKLTVMVGGGWEAVTST